MTRLVLAAAIAAILLIAVVVGWGACWLWMRTRRSGRHERDRARLAELAAALHAAQAALDGAERRAAEAEAAREAERERVEAEFRGVLAERQAELDGAMETLGHARREAAEWRRAYETLAQDAGAGAGA